MYELGDRMHAMRYVYRRRIMRPCLTLISVRVQEDRKRSSTARDQWEGKRTNYPVGWLFSHLRVTFGIGHAVDSPLSSVASYMRAQQTYSSRICLAHLSGEYVFLFRQACKSQAARNGCKMVKVGHWGF